jgi:glycosyltransferase involved in cell wall biosynthesis
MTWGAEEKFDSQALFGRTVLQIVPALDASLDSFACVEVAAALADDGARALVAGSPGPAVSDLQARGGVFLPFPMATRNPLTEALNRRRLAQIADREGVELIHVRGSAGLKSALFAAREARIPIVAEIDGDRRGLALEADSIVVFSRRIMEETVTAHPEIASRLHRGLRGVDLRPFAFESIDFGRVRRLREGLGAQPHERLIIGLDLPRSQQNFFLAAAAQLKNKGFFSNGTQEARFVWLHREGEPPSGFKAEAARRGLQDYVLSLPWSDRAAACLAAALVIVPAREPGLCIEAQALGAATALLDEEGLTGSAEIIVAPPNVDAVSRTGWLIPPVQAGALARAAEEAVRLGASAREMLAAQAQAQAGKFSVERMRQLTLSVYARHFSRPAG